MKHEWKKHEKDLYLPKDKPVLITVPEQKFFMINGKGNPNGEDFAERVSVLYSLAYAVRMMPKQGDAPAGYFEYTVYPLEGIWDLSEKGRELDTLCKDELVYTIMIRQPDFVTQDIADKDFENVRKKKPHPLLDEVYFGSMEDGLSVQMMHTGSYDDEIKTFEEMKKFIRENRLEGTTLTHREIYISDPKKTEKSRLKTVLRYNVRYI